MSLDYIGRKVAGICQVCGEVKTSVYYKWYTIFSPDKTTCCHRCAVREYGKTYVNAIKERGEKDVHKRP